MKVFILEDDPSRNIAFEEVLEGHDLTISRFLSGEDGAFSKWKPPYSLVLLDHDLGGMTFCDPEKEETGEAFASFISKDVEKEKGMRVIIHSWNPEGARRMLQEIHEGGGKASLMPFSLSLLSMLRRLKEESKDEKN